MLNVGDLAPVYEATADDGQTFVVVYFYPAAIAALRRLSRN